MKGLSLICETPHLDLSEYTISVDQENNGKPKSWYISGPFTEANKRNRNNRIYPLEEMVQQINEFNTNLVSQNRALGELEHPEYPQINAAEACHLITEIKQDGNVFIGKSKILPTPKGKIVEGLLQAGVKLGISSRSLGEVDPTGRVTDFQLCTFDIVSDPSCQIAFVDGILESKKFICLGDGKYETVYEKLEKDLATLPQMDKEKENYIFESIMRFLNNLK